MWVIELHKQTEHGTQVVMERKAVDADSFTADITVKRGLCNVTVTPTRERKSRAKKYEEGKE